jgi:hypothetical protein
MTSGAAMALLPWALARSSGRHRQAQPARGQEDQQHEPAAEKPDQGEDDFSVDVEQYHIFTTPRKDKRNDLCHEEEVNTVMPADHQFMHWSKAAITWGAMTICD